MALTYAVAAANRGEHAVIFAFDEGLGTIYARCESLKFRFANWSEYRAHQNPAGDPAEMSPGEFVRGSALPWSRTPGSL